MNSQKIHIFTFPLQKFYKKFTRPSERTIFQPIAKKAPFSFIYPQKKALIIPNVSKLEVHVSEACFMIEKDTSLFGEF